MAVFTTVSNGYTKSFALPAFTKVNFATVNGLAVDVEEAGNNAILKTVGTNGQTIVIDYQPEGAAPSNVTSNSLAYQTLATYPVSVDDNGFNLIYNGTDAGLWTIPSGITLGNNFGVYIENRSVNRQPLRVTPASGTINGLSSFTIPLGSGVFINSNGTSELIASRVPANNGRITLAKGNIPLLIPPTGVVDGSVGGNAIVTLDVALNETLSEGCYMLLPANGAYAGSPSGWYYTVFSTDRVGTIYNNYRLSTDYNPVTIPTAPSAITSGRGATAYATVLNTQHTMARFQIAANTIGMNGRVEVKAVVSHSNSANAKNLLGNYGGYAFYQNSPSTGTMFSALFGFANLGNTARQKAIHADYGTGGYAAANATLNKGTINTAVDNNMALLGQLAAAGGSDWLILQSYVIELIQ